MSPMLSLYLLALALASDAFAVALCQGAIAKPHPWRQALSIGAAFGIAQAVAPLIGWGLGIAFAGLIESIDHWIAFTLLSLVGGKMLIEGARNDPPGEQSKSASGKALFLLAVATSIDAAAAGFTLPTIGVGIAPSIAVIGGVTFILSATGVWIGRMSRRALGSRAEILGGVVLIGLGAKILVDHHAFG